MELTFGQAKAADAAALVALQTAASERLTREHGRGHWSSSPAEERVVRSLEASRVLVARDGSRIVGKLRLVTKKPWAIDPAYFTAVRKPLYLLDMAVEPALQRQGIGRRLLDEALAVARAWPGDAIRLDAYDHAAGAGGFYAQCGFREVGRVTYRSVPLVYFEWVL